MMETSYDLSFELTDDMENELKDILGNDDYEPCDEYYIEQNLWRLPVGLLMLGITSINNDDDENNVRESILAVQKESREKANWLIYKALDDPNYVIELALNHYGSEVFKMRKWDEYPELMNL